jgi:hypothetical protein
MVILDIKARIRKINRLTPKEVKFEFHKIGIEIVLASIQEKTKKSIIYIKDLMHYSNILYLKDLENINQAAIEATEILAREQSFRDNIEETYLSGL